jgi:AcrR family transcriptional regulator
MMHLATLQAADENVMKAPTRRALAKQQTRAKVLAAARRLFSEQGYEGATIRDIAAAAGMSTGAVFANFADKSDLFREIMITDMAALGEAMREAASHGDGVEDAILRAFMAGYAFYMTQLPLARAAFSVGWSTEDGPALRGAAAARSLRDLIAERLTRTAQGDAQAALRADMLFEAYLSNYPQAIFENWTLDDLRARSRDQIGILLAGLPRD